METQWSVVVAMLANHDSVVNTRMAEAARSDNGMMRRMTVVTVGFLLAMFLAIFSSMTFFRVDSKALYLNSSI
jgi:hypothetical protein